MHKRCKGQVIGIHFASANNRSRAGDYLLLDPITGADSNMEMKRGGVQKMLHRIANVWKYLAKWHGRQNLQLSLYKTHTQNTQMIDVRYISDTEVIVKVSCSQIQHNGLAGWKLLSKSPLPPGSAVKDLPGGRTQVLNVHRFKWIDHQLPTTDQYRSPAAFRTTNIRLTGMSTW